jgi:hypothetical protein
MKSDVALVAKAESFSSRIAGRAQEQDDQPQNVRLVRQPLGQLHHAKSSRLYSRPIWNQPRRELLHTIIVDVAAPIEASHVLCGSRRCSGDTSHGSGASRALKARRRNRLMYASIMVSALDPRVFAARRLRGAGLVRTRIGVCGFYVQARSRQS